MLLVFVEFSEHCKICHMSEPYSFSYLQQVQGVLSAVVLSLIPIIRPFQWQSLFLPVRSVT